MGDEDIRKEYIIQMEIILNDDPNVSEKVLTFPPLRTPLARPSPCLSTPLTQLCPHPPSPTTLPVSLFEPSQYQSSIYKPSSHTTYPPPITPALLLSPPLPISSPFTLPVHSPTLPLLPLQRSPLLTLPHNSTSYTAPSRPLPRHTPLLPLPFILLPIHSPPHPLHPSSIALTSIPLLLPSYHCYLYQPLHGPSG